MFRRWHLGLARNSLIDEITHYSTLTVAHLTAFDGHYDFGQSQYEDRILKLLTRDLIKWTNFLMEFYIRGAFQVILTEKLEHQRNVGHYCTTLHTDLHFTLEIPSKDIFQYPYSGRNNVNFVLNFIACTLCECQVWLCGACKAYKHVPAAILTIHNNTRHLPSDLSPPPTRPALLHPSSCPTGHCTPHHFLALFWASCSATGNLVTIGNH